MDNRATRQPAAITAPAATICPAQPVPAADSCRPIIVHNHYCTITGNGNVLNNGHDMATGVAGADLQSIIRAQAATIDRLLNLIEVQARQLAALATASPAASTQ